MCAAQSLRKASSRLPLWGALVPSGHRSALDRAGRREWPRVSEDGEGEVSAAPSHGLCRSAGGLPSQSPSGDSSPRGRRGQPAPGAHVRYSLDEHERSELPKARIDSGGTPPFGKGASLFP